MPRTSRSELVPGTLDMLVLHTLTLGSLHGYAIAQHIEKLFRERAEAAWRRDLGLDRVMLAIARVMKRA